MKRKILWLVVSCLVVAALLLASCASAVTEEKEVVTEKEAVTKEKEVVTEKEVAELERKEAVAVAEGKEMVRDALGKLVEKPRYGGLFTMVRTATPTYFNAEFGLFLETGHGATLPYEMPYQWDWLKGPAGSGEWNGYYTDWIRMDEIAGSLAESWEIAEGDRLIYHVRQGVHWQNKAPGYGREVDAYDFEYAFRRMWSVPTSLVARTYPARLYLKYPAEEIDKAIYATDKWTLVIEASPVYMYQVWQQSIASAYFSIYPRESAKFDMNDWRNQGGTGPFILKDYVPGSLLSYVRNPNYWMKDPLFPENQLPYLDAYKELIIADISTRLAALRTAKIDRLGGGLGVGGSITWEDAESLKKTNPELGYIWFQRKGPPVIFMRVDKPEQPWYDKRVRRALQMAIDRYEIKDKYYGGHGGILAWPVNAHQNAFKGTWRPLEEMPESVRELFTYSPEKAKALLTEAGYPNGFKAKIIMVLEDVDLVLIVKDFWKKNLNVDLEVQVLESGAFGSIITYQKQEEMVMSSTQNDQFSYQQMRPENTSSNKSVINDKYFNEYIYPETMRLWRDEAARDKIAYDTNPYLIDQAYFIQLPTPDTYIFWQPWLKNHYAVTNTGYYVYTHFSKYVWLDLDLKEQITGKR